MIFNCIRLFLVFTLVCGVFYPGVITVVGKIFFAYKAEGSIIRRGDIKVASELIGQNFTSEKYFWGRPSATSPFPYNGAASSGSNLAQNNQSLIDAVRTRWQAIDPDFSSVVPTDILTASGSGLDPHISKASALLQVKRVAESRKISEQNMIDIIEKITEPGFLNVVGESRVNVVKLNLALDNIN